jgi:hypothetical protein
MNLLQLETISGCVGWGVATPLPTLVVVLVMVLVFVEVEGTMVLVDGLVAMGVLDVVLETGVLDVVLGIGVGVGASSVTVPITQYWLSVSRAAQLIPGFNVLRSSTDSPQLSEKLSHVAPLSVDVKNPQSTPRRT